VKLMKCGTSHEFAVLVLTPDDTVMSRGKKSGIPRDNVLFELELFAGGLGRERTFVVCDRKATKIPSDWFGMTFASFDWNRAKDPKEVTSAVSPACTQILQAIRSAPRASAPTRESSRHIVGIDELYFAISQTSSSQSGVVISHNETSWAWKLFPTIFEWTLCGTPITLFLSPAHGNKKQLRQEHYRRGLLQNLGARLITRRALPLTGFFFDTKDESNLDVIVLTQDSSGYKPIAFKYDANCEREAAKALLSTLPVVWEQTSAEFRPSITRYSDKDVAKLLETRVSHYKQDGVTIKPTFVETRELQVISRYTRAYKYRQIKRMADWYKRARVKPFKTMAITLRDGSSSIVTPPIVEKGRDGFVVIEGNSRATYCLHHGIDRFFCLLAEGVAEPPPGQPCPLAEVKLSERTLPPEERIDKFDYSRFRQIERAVHPY